jgi:pyridoxamine 5'-phosphate oxidase
MDDPLQLLSEWLAEARASDAPAPAAMTLATVGEDGRPSARVLSLKRLDADGLLFTTGLWTRKAEELRSNPWAAAVFHWPALGRQARVEGRVKIAERTLAEELFAARPRGHQLQTLVSRQGEPIDGIGPLRTRLDQLRAEAGDTPLPCPEDWGAIRLVPEALELWSEESDRLHDRLRYSRSGDEWQCARLAP